MTKPIKSVGLSFFFLLSFSMAIRAQETPTFQEKPRKVKMPKYFLADLPKKSIPLTGIRVIQAVWDSTRLGFVQKGMANVKAEAMPAKDLTTFLQDYVTKQYEEGYKKTGSHLLIVIKELRINERTFFSSEVAFTKMVADAWMAGETGNYKKVASIDTVNRYSSMADVTSVHGENIARGIDNLVLLALDNAKNNKWGSGELTAEEIGRKERERFQLPILTATELKAGAYMNFREFLDNAPSIAAFETNVLDKKKGKVEITSADGNKSVITPWGICKDGEIYKYHEQELIALEKNNDGFIFSDYQQRATRRNTGIFMGGLLGGLAGTAIASSSNRMFAVTAIPYITKKQPEACAIDMRTGELSF